MRIRSLTGQSIHSRALEAIPAPTLLVDLGLVLALISLPLLPNLPLPLVLYLCVMYALHIGSATHPRLKVSRWLPPILMIIAVIAILKYYRTLFGYEAGIALFTLLLGPKLLEIRKRRDFNTTVTIGLFLVVLQFLLDQSFIKALYMLPLVIALFAVLIQSNRAAPLARSEALTLSLRMLVQALPIVFITFFLFPRLSQPLWALNLKLDRLGTRIGLSDEMTPGSIDTLIHSDEVAFRAEIPGPPLSAWNLYWRGPVFWHTDGLKWDGSHPPLLMRKYLTHTSGKVSYRVILEPTGKRWVLALDLPSEISTGAYLGADYQVRSKQPIDQRSQFFLVSFLHYQTGAISPMERTAALQLPPYNSTSRLVALVKDWQKRANGQPRQIVEQALAFFRRENFVYTLNPPPLGASGIEAFIFDTKAGFCEHYAGAFTLLMRLAGIPSRVVTGYLGGEYNDLGKYYIVHQEDAHAWSEVWLDDVGWTRVDPTAAVAPERIQHAIFNAEEATGAPVLFRLEDFKGLEHVLQRLRLTVDAINTHWDMWILGYNAQKQTMFMQLLKLDFLDNVGIAVFMVIMVIILGTLLAWILGNQAPPDTTDIPTKLYQRLCKRLAKVGILRPDREGPQDFASRVARRRPDLADDIEAMTAIYIRLRYSKRPRPNDIEVLKQQLANFYPQRLR